MLKKLLIGFIVFVLIGSFLVGYTDNRVLFTLKNNIPLELRTLLKNTIFFPFSHNSRIADLTKTNSKAKFKNYRFRKSSNLFKRINTKS